MSDPVFRVDVHLKSGNVLKLRVTKFEITPSKVSWTTYRRFWQRHYHPIFLERDEIAAVIQRSH